MKNINITEKLNSAGAFIKDNKTPLLYVSGAIAITIIGIAIVKKFKKGIGDFLNNPTIKATPFVAIEVDNSKATISDAMANSYANQLYNAMKITGTDENIIYAVLQKLQKADDFRKVYNAFGKRSYANTITSGTSPDSIDTALGLFDDLDLVEWMVKEVGILNYPTYSLIRKTVKNAGLAI